MINPETGKRSGMIFGSSPCLSSEWGYDYFQKIRKFYEKTSRIREQEGKSVKYTLDRDYSVILKVNLPATGYTWFVGNKHLIIIMPWLVDMYSYAKASMSFSVILFKCFWN